jgi:hypothetical protein
VHHWNGATWTEIPLPAEAQPIATFGYLWATSSDDVWISGGVIVPGVSQDPVLVHWDGTALRVHSFGPFSGGREFINGIWASSPDDVWVAGGSSIGAKVSHFDGAVWTELKLPGGDGSVSHDVWGWCPTNLWADADVGVWHFDGTSWVRVSTKSTTLDAISGTGPDDAWISGSVSFPIVLHWQKNVCGDQVIGAGEECDPPRALGSSGVPVCDQTCHIPTCGNLTLDAGETCDPPNDITCDRQCQSIPVVCGNGILQPGETCEYASSDLCQNCQLTTCGGCFETTGGGGVCSGLSVEDARDCYALVGCMANNWGACTKPYGGYGCYCGGPTCSAAPTGVCKSQFEALAHSTDPAVVSAQLGDQTTLVGKVTVTLVRFGTSHCGMYCPPR